MKGSAQKDKNTYKLRLAAIDDTPLLYPKQESPYTILEPLRFADFMDWQYKAAETLTETNKKLNDILTDRVIEDLKTTIANMNKLSARSSETLDKVDTLLDSSKEDIDRLLDMTKQATDDFSRLSNNINNLIGDPKFKSTIVSAADSVGKLSKNLNKIMDAADAEQTGQNIKIITQNLAQISESVNAMTSDGKLKSELSSAITNINSAMAQMSIALETVNNVDPNNKQQVSDLKIIIDDTVCITENLKKFSEKLNKRFLLFRLLF